MCYAILEEEDRVLVMQFSENKERERFIRNNPNTKIQPVDEGNQYVQQALALKEPFPVIVYKRAL